MKTKSAIYRYVPKTAYKELNKWLATEPPEFKFETDTFVFILDLFYRLNEYNLDVREKKGGFTEISSRYFRASIPNGYASYVGYLIRKEIVLTDGSFDKEKHICLGYKINPTMESKLIQVAINPESPIAHKIRENANRKRKLESKQAPFIRKLKENLKLIQFDEKKAVKFLNKQLFEGELSLNKYNRHMFKLTKILNKQFYCKRNRTNFRLDTTFTNLLKELRYFIVGGYITIDLCNSQPYLLVYILRKYLEYVDKRNNQIAVQVNNDNNCIDKVLPSSCGEDFGQKGIDRLLDKAFRKFKNVPILDLEEVRKFNEITRTNQFYNLFMDEFGIIRDDAKKLTLATLYSPNRFSNYEAEKQVFRRQFPTIYAFIYEFKRKDYKKLSITMQILESTIFIDCVAKYLVEQGIELDTIHDSLIVKEQDEPQAMFALEYTFMKFFGELPSFKTEKLCSDDIDIEIYHVFVEKYKAVA